MIPPEILRGVRQIEIRANRAVNDVLAGQYESVFKGRGMEFDEVREYQVGDDVRAIDWNVTARMGHPFIMKYVEERELTVMLLVDLSRSGQFGSVRQLKSEVAAYVAALLAFSATKNNDKVGLLIFTDRIEKFIPPKKGRRHVLRLIRELLYTELEGVDTDLPMALEHLTRMLRKRAVVFLISDFITADFEKPLRLANRRHDLIAVSIADPRERRFEPAGMIELEDAETGKAIIVDTGSRSLRRRYEAAGRERAGRLREAFKATGVDQIEIEAAAPLTRRTSVETGSRLARLRSWLQRAGRGPEAGQDRLGGEDYYLRTYVQPLVRFFRMREHRK